MKWVPWLALVFGIVGTVLGGIALAEGGDAEGDESPFKELTLNLQGADEQRGEFPAPAVSDDHPEGTIAWESVATRSN